MDVYVTLRYGLEYMPVFNDMIQLKILSKDLMAQEEKKGGSCKGHTNGISRRRAKKRRKEKEEKKEEVEEEEEKEKEKEEEEEEEE